jgi:hypothetical protein
MEPMSEAEIAARVAEANANRQRKIDAQNGDGLNPGSRVITAGGYDTMQAMLEQLRGAQGQVHNRAVGGATPLSDGAAAAITTGVKQP